MTNNQPKSLSGNGGAMIDRDIEDLTKKILWMCQGKDMAVVIGASLNMIMTCAQAMPDASVRAGLIKSFNHIVYSLEQQGKKVRQ